MEKQKKNNKIEEIKEEYKKAFPKDFYEWSEYGFWLEKFQSLQFAHEEEVRKLENHLLEKEDEVAVLKWKLKEVRKEEKYDVIEQALFTAKILTNSEKEVRKTLLALVPRIDGKVQPPYDKLFPSEENNKDWENRFEDLCENEWLVVEDRDKLIIRDFIRSEIQKAKEEERNKEHFGR